jgi:tetratricopeptide (TPR) repeat protein
MDEQELGRRHKMTKRNRTKPSTPKSTQMETQVVVSEYEITSEPIIEPQYKRLPENVKSRIEQLHTLVQKQPGIAIPELETLVEVYPNIPMLYNYLSAAYSAAGETEKAENLIKKNYQLHPDYLFARLNYAQLCLQRKEYNEIAQIFDRKFDLKLLYPKRKRFHISELTGFFGVIGQYFYYTGERALAENVYRILYEFAPKNHYTNQLKRLLHPNFFQRIFHSQGENS